MLTRPMEVVASAKGLPKMRPSEKEVRWPWPYPFSILLSDGEPYWGMYGYVCGVVGGWWLAGTRERRRRGGRSDGEGGVRRSAEATTSCLGDGACMAVVWVRNVVSNRRR